VAIRDQGYKVYEGDLSAGSSPVWVVASTHMGLYWSLLRTKLLFIVLMIVPVLFLVFTFAEQLLTKMFGQGGGAAKITGIYEYSFGYLQMWMLALMLAAAGCGVVADDMRYRTIQLYFSKPIKKTQYILGKYLSLLMLGSLVTLVPYVVVGAVRVLLFIPRDTFTEILTNLAALGLFNVVLLALFSVIVMALSCLTSRTGYVVLAWLGTILIPSVVATVTGLILKEEPWTVMLSVVGNLDVGLKKLVGYQGVPVPGQIQPEALPDYMTWSPWVILVLLAAGAVAIINWRTSKLEGIA
jgi:ABC-2 type transport system permease protein